MSGRIRTIKPELLEDAVTASLSDMAFRLFIATILLADDYGRLRAEPGWLMGQIYWARSVSVEGFLGAIGELGPLVQFYEVKGQRYAEIRNWSKHQKVDRPGKPRIPQPSEDSRESRDGVASHSRLISDLRPVPTTNDQDHRSLGTQSGALVPTEVGALGNGSSGAKTKPKAGRGCRLPAGWAPSDEAQAWAKSNGIAEPCGRFLDEFRDFWSSVPGARGCKLDWDAVFRNRVRQVADRRSGPHSKQPLGAQTSAPWMRAGGGDL